MTRIVQVCYFNTWAAGVEDAMSYVVRVPQLDLRPMVVAGATADLMRKARLDCDWYAENTRCFASLAAEKLEFRRPLVCGRQGLLEYAAQRPEGQEERWLILMGQQPQSLGSAAGPALAFLRRAGVRILFYAFDEASRFMACFREVAPHLDVLIHDESPLDRAGERALRPECRRLHRSWVANIVPFAPPFVEAPEPKIVFLGSQLGLTPHRQRQIGFLKARFKDRFTALHDHSLNVADRFSLNRYAVSVCPEGRRFTTPAMAESHTDRPFWSGCLGLVPVSEDSKVGGRLEALAKAGLIVRYAHGDLESLREGCERGLATSAAERRRIYEHFNRQETVGTVVAEAIAAAG